jgi:hypothetical protein
LSRGGIALLCHLPVALGAEVSVELPQAGSPVTGKVVRAESGRLGIAFRDDDATRSRVERAMLALAKTQRAA